MEKLFIDVLNRQTAEDRIDQISKRLGMDWSWEYNPSNDTSIYSLDPNFPINEIEHEWWFCGYALKEA